MSNSKINRMKELNEILSKASDAYYNTSDTIMSDAEYDKLYDELSSLESETGIILNGSRTQNVGYEVSSYLPKVQHPRRMLSLDKTKSREELASWLGTQKGWLSWKLDGLTLCLYYDNGTLTQAVSRGNGEIGEDMTNNARQIKGIPLRIPFKGHLALRGEALIGYTDFNNVNKDLPEGTEPYKNPRNLASGTLRSLDSKIVAERNVNFFAFTLVSAEGYDNNSVESRLNWLASLGFQTVYGRSIVGENDLKNTIEWFSNEIKNNDFPSDGLVLMYDDVSYGESLGETSHHPRNGMAFKWKDETAETTLRKIEWSASKTGLLNPVAVFDTVEIEGTSVSRASVHNLSIIRKLNLNIGDKITVYKANMIIPQIGENLTKHESNVDDLVPKCCPVCGGDTQINISADGIETVVCTNDDCIAKKVGKFEHFVSRDAMNIMGIAVSTIEDLISHNMLSNFMDFYHLDKYRDIIVKMEGFGEKSYTEMINGIENSRNTELWRVLYSLSIPFVGRTASKIICKNHSDPNTIPELKPQDLMNLDGIGETLANEYVRYWDSPDNKNQYFNLLKELNIKQSEVKKSGITGKTFVITGSVEIWKNRNELKEFIESNGGKVASSVSKNTDYLINNDSTSGSSKNKKAKELGVSIITESEFKNMV